MFSLHPNFSDKIFITDLPLCRVLLEDDSRYPWLLLIPRQPNLAHSFDLSAADQIVLFSELNLSQRILWNLFHPTRVNIAALGNKTPQLHFHVIARFEGDAAWPGAVWDKGTPLPYAPSVRATQIQHVAAAFAALAS